MANSTYTATTTYKTNFQKVMEFNRAFDMVPKEPKTYSCYCVDAIERVKINPLKNVRKNIFTENPKIIQLRLDLIKEELEELNVAIKENDIIEQRDACADILYVVYGMADVLGISIDDVFHNNAKSSYFEYYRDIDSNKPNYKKYFEMCIDKFLSATDRETNTISNFNYIKHFTNEMLRFNINDVIKEHLIELIQNKLNTSYQTLEKNCFIKFNYIPDSNYDMFRLEAISYNLYQLLKWAYMMTLVIGYDADADFAIVHESNMSKLCDNENDAKATVADYEDKYKSGSSPYDSPYYYYLPDLNKWIVKNKSSGKALKNIKYKKVAF
jgi:hypothetical protein